MEIDQDMKLNWCCRTSEH